MSLALVKFGMYPDVTYLLVGVAKDYKLNPRSVGGGFIYTYRVNSRNQPQMPAGRLQTYLYS